MATYLRSVLSLQGSQACLKVVHGAICKLPSGALRSKSCDSAVWPAIYSNKNVLHACMQEGNASGITSVMTSPKRGHRVNATNQ